jgi:hypothetical protein
MTIAELLAELRPGFLDSCPAHRYFLEMLHAGHRAQDLMESSDWNPYLSSDDLDELAYDGPRKFWIDTLAGYGLIHQVNGHWKLTKD